MINVIIEFRGGNSPPNLWVNSKFTNRLPPICKALHRLQTPIIDTFPYNIYWKIISDALLSGYIGENQLARD
jgi:hypothetical protein